MLLVRESKHPSRLPAMASPRLDLQLGSPVGMAGWSDIHPATVVARSHSGRRVTVRRDKAVLDPTWTPEWVPGGFAAHCANQHDQRWLISPDPDGALAEFSLRRDGQWWAVGQQIGAATRLVPTRCFYDFNF